MQSKPFVGYFHWGVPNLHRQAFKQQITAQCADRASLVLIVCLNIRTTTKDMSLRGSKLLIAVGQQFVSFGLPVLMGWSGPPTLTFDGVFACSGDPARCRGSIADYTSDGSQPFLGMMISGLH
jgi:hypothetical protein